MLAHYTFVFNRKNQPLKRGEKALVQLRLTINRKSTFYSTGIYIEKKRWKNDVENKAWVAGDPNSNDYNDLLENILIKIRSAEIKAKNEGNKLSPTLVKQLIRNDGMVGSFINFMESESRKRSDISDGTKRHVAVNVKKLRDFGLVDFSDLTLENISAIDARFRKEGLKDSTIDRFHAQMIAYINRAIRLDLIRIDKNPYLKFKRKRPKYTDRKYLTAEELQLIEKKEMEMDRLIFVKDLFLFCCYTGLSFSDLEALKPDNIIEENDKLFIKTFRQKTDERSTIYLFEKTKVLLEKYAGQRNGYCFPKISNQKMNAYLKEIATLSKVKKNLTAHMARHTFATTIMLNQGASLEVTQKALGHKKIETTQIYAKMLSNRIADEMSKVEDKLKKE